MVTQGTEAGKSEARPIGRTPGGKLAKLDQIRGLFLWPMTLWFAILVADFAVYILEINALRSARVLVGEVAFYTLPLMLMYLVLISFYSSYQILGSRGHKNIAAFFFFQFLAYFVIVELGLELPVYSKVTSVALTVVIALVVLGVVLIVQHRLSISEDAGGAELTERRHQATGMIIAALVSLIIASMVYFRVRGGIAFVSWGVFFGATLAAMLLRSERMILGILYFLDPAGASALYQLIRSRERVEAQKDRTDVEREHGFLHKEEMRTLAVRLANELESELTRAHFEQGKERIRFFIDTLKKAANLSPSEQERRLAEVQQLLGELRDHGEFPLLLPEVSSANLSLGEKVLEQIGLSEEECSQAVAEGVIAQQQSYLWSPSVQVKLRTAMLDLDNNRYKGTPPFYVAESAVDFLERNRFVFEALIRSWTNNLVGSSAVPLKGLESRRLLVFEFPTVTNHYSCVLRQGADDSYVILGIFQRDNDLATA